MQINPTAFTDTTDKNVLAANALGIINGVGNNRFDPNGTFTRAQIAAILNRTAEVLGVETDGYTHTFTDVSGHWVSDSLGRSEEHTSELQSLFDPGSRMPSSA